MSYNDEISAAILEAMDETCDPAMAAYTAEQVVDWIRWMVANLREDVGGCPVARANRAETEGTK